MPHMELIWWVLIFSIIGGIFSLIGGVLLIKNDSWVKQNTLVLVSWAAGVLLSVAFLDLMPESVEMGIEKGMEAHDLFKYMLYAILGFFVFERSFVWFHHHHEPDVKPPLSSMLIFGDSVHNFIDGIVIGTAFLVSVPTGIMAALAVAAHEIPQEIADFVVLLRSGMTKVKVVMFNVVSALMTIVGSLGVMYFAEIFENITPQLLAFAGGMFTYIACSDLIPELHHHKSKSVAIRQVVSFFAGVCITYLLVTITHGS